MEFVIDKCWIKPTPESLEKISINRSNTKRKLQEIKTLNKNIKIPHYVGNAADKLDAEREYFWEIIEEIYLEGKRAIDYDKQTPEEIEHRFSVLDKHRALVRDETLPVLIEIFPEIDKPILTEIVEITIEMGKEKWLLLMQKRIDEIENDEFIKLIEICRN